MRADTDQNRDTSEDWLQLKHKQSFILIPLGGTWKETHSSCYSLYEKEQERCSEASCGWSSHVDLPKCICLSVSNGFVIALPCYDDLYEL